nr:DNA replication protein [Escherichia coli]UWM22239.1 DNA replication protein [Klebsiella pneumoniae]
MGSCAAPSAKGDDKFITTDYLQQCRLTKPTKAAAGIGLANRKPCTVSQPACRNHARQSGVSTPSATTSIVVFRRRLH